MLEAERERVAAVSRTLAAEGLVLAAAGNVSARRGERIAVTPAGARLESVQADEVVVVDLDGKLVDGERAPTSELALHRGTYLRYDVGAVIHTHAPAATAVGCVTDELPAIHYQMVAFGGAVRVAPFATPGSEELAELTLAGLADRHAVLMANHGTLTVGEDLDAALDRARLLEWVSDLYLRASRLGTPRTLSAEQLSEVAAAIARRAL